MQWMKLSKKAEVQPLKTEIKKIDNQIDPMDYELCGLTEKKIVAASAKKNIIIFKIKQT